MRNVVAYCRVSTNKEDQLNSFETQKKFFTEYAENNNLNLIKIYADEGITGTSTKNRTAFNEMMRDSEKKIFEMVLVKDISRLARNTVDLLQSVRKLKSLNIDMRFITANMATLGESEFILTIFGALAQEESANMSKRVKFGKRVNAKKGRVPNICYGYIKTKGDYFDLQINEFEAGVVKEIYDLYVNQGYGTYKIAKILNDRGLKSARGVNWSTVSVSRILKNKIYAGYIINGKSEIKDFITKERIITDESEWYEVEKPELRIIDLELWQQAQEVNKTNNDKVEQLHKKRSNKHLFSSLITCPVCGYSFRRFTAQRLQYKKIWWSCSGRNHHGANFCTNKTTIPEEELISFIDEYLTSFISNKDKLINQILKQSDQNKDTKSNSMLTAQLAKLQKKRQKYIEMFEEDLISMQEFKPKVEEINQQIQKIELDISEPKTSEDVIKSVNALFKNITEQFKKYSSIAQMSNAELKCLIKEIIAGENGDIKIKLNY